MRGGEWWLESHEQLTTSGCRHCFWPWCVLVVLPVVRQLRSSVCLGESVAATALPLALTCCFKHRRAFLHTPRALRTRTAHSCLGHCTGPIQTHTPAHAPLSPSPFRTAGFIAKNPAGQVTTLKRNGSDYSATIMGALFQVGVRVCVMGWRRVAMSCVRVMWCGCR